MQKQLVQAGVVRELGVKRGDQHPSLTSGDGMPLPGGQHLDLRAGALDPRSPDEHGADRIAAEVRDAHIGLEAPDLPPERDTADLDVDEPEGRRKTLDGRSRDHDEAGTRAEHGAAGGVEGDDRLIESGGAHEPAHGRALSAGDDETVEAGQIVRATHFEGTGAETLEHDAMLSEVALERENAHR